MKLAKSLIIITALIALALPLHAGEPSADSPQSLYLQAGKEERSGSSVTARAIYESIIDRFPESEFAVKANDRLLLLPPAKQKIEPPSASSPAKLSVTDHRFKNGKRVSAREVPPLKSPASPQQNYTRQATDLRTETEDLLEEVPSPYSLQPTVSSLSRSSTKNSRCTPPLIMLCKSHAVNEKSSIQPISRIFRLRNASQSKPVQNSPHQIATLVQITAASCDIAQISKYPE